MSREPARHGAVMVEFDGRTQTFGAEGGQVSVGRTADCAVRVADSLVSRHHAELVFDGGWVLRDLGSTNGCWTDGRRVQQVRLSDRASVRLGGPAGPELWLEAVANTSGSAAEPVPPGPPGVTRTALPHVAGHSHRQTPRPPGAASTGRRIIGRDPRSWHVVDDPVASWHHASLTAEAEGHWLTDLGSTNATLVNGRPATRHLLREGDRVLVGNTTLEWRGQSLDEVEGRGFTVDGACLEIAGGRRIVDRVSFSIREPSLVAVIGPSGAGKSSLLRLVTGEATPSAGTVALDGSTMTSQRRAHRGQIGVVPQDTLAHGTLGARVALDLTAKLRLPPDVGGAERDRLVADVLELMGLTDHADTRINTLSGGQQRRVGIGMELLTNPSMLILDEPTAGLDPALVRQIMRMLRQLADSGKRVLLVTHDLEHLDLVDQVVVLRAGGTAAYVGPPAGVFTHFGTGSWADTFALLAVPEPHQDKAGATSGGGTNIEALDLPPARTDAATTLRQTRVVLERQTRLVAADRPFLALSLAMPLVLALLSFAVPGSSGLGPSSDPASAEAARLLVLVIVGAAFLGMSGPVRDLVGERGIYAHERRAGLQPFAYLTAKLTAFSVIASVQAAFLVALVVAFRPGPAEGSVLPSGELELGVGVALTALVGVALGLSISARINTPEQAMPPLVVAIMGQLVMCGGLFPLDGRGVLGALSAVFPSRWGYAAAASTVDLNRGSQAIDPDPLWTHVATTWWGCVMVLTAMLGLLVWLAWTGLRKERG